MDSVLDWDTIAITARVCLSVMILRGWLSACKRCRYLEIPYGIVSLRRYVPEYRLTIAATSPAPTEGSFDSGGDELPPFAQLATDEDREKKAVRSTPGTYHVVVNPDSFQHLPEYSDDPEIKKEKFSPSTQGLYCSVTGK